MEEEEEERHTSLQPFTSRSGPDIISIRSSTSAAGSRINGQLSNSANPSLYETSNLSNVLLRHKSLHGHSIIPIKGEANISLTGCMAMPWDMWRPYTDDDAQHAKHCEVN